MTRTSSRVNFGNDEQLVRSRKTLKLQGRHYAYRFGEATDIEPRNELKIPASRPASAATPVRLLAGHMRLFTIGRDRCGSGGVGDGGGAGLWRRSMCVVWRKSWIRANLRRMPQSMSKARRVRRAARRLRGDCRVLRPHAPAHVFPLWFEPCIVRRRRSLLAEIA